MKKISSGTLAYEVGATIAAASNTVTTLRNVLEKYQEKLPDFQRKYGGFLCIMDIRTGKIIKTTLIGAVPSEKAERYKSLSQEKAQRLFLNIKGGHITSYESRSPQGDKWGGAIATEKLIISFSGFPEDGDTFICLTTAHETMKLKEEYKKRIIEITNIGYLVEVPELKKLLQ